MIKVLRGIVIEILENSVILEVSGFGILVKVLMGDEICGVGSEETLYTNLIITENNVGIYGFKCKEKCEMFERLVKIKGVGPSTGINILNEVRDLDNIGLDELLNIRGIGSKLANTIINDLRPKKHFDINIKEFVKLGFKHDDVIQVINELNISNTDRNLNKKILEKLCEVKNDSM